jgi:hypothetical protein
MGGEERFTQGKGKLKFIQKQATTAQRGNRGIALYFL